MIRSGKTRVPEILSNGHLEGYEIGRRKEEEKCFDFRNWGKELYVKITGKKMCAQSKNQG